MQRRQHKLMRSRTQHEEDRDIVMQRLRTSSYSPMLENGLPSPQSPAMEIPSKGLFRTKSTPEGLIASEAASSSASGSPDSDNNSQFPKSLPRRTNSRWSMKNCENCHMIFVGEGTCCTQECRLCLELRERPSEVAHLVETALPQQNEAPASGYFSYDVWNVSPKTTMSCNRSSPTRGLQLTQPQAKFLQDQCRCLASWMMELNRQIGDAI